MKRSIIATTLSLSLLAVSATAVAAQDTSDRLALSEDGSEVPVPGAYLDTSLGVPLEFDVTEGWDFGSSDIYGITLQSNDVGDPLFTVSEFQGRVYELPCPSEGNDAYFQNVDDTVEVSAQAFMETVAANPFLGLPELVPFEASGSTGVMADVIVETAPRCSDGQTYLFEVLREGETLFNFSLADGVSARIIAFDAGEKTLIAVLEATDAGGYAAALEPTMTIMESMAVAAEEPAS